MGNLIHIHIFTHHAYLLFLQFIFSWKMDFVMEKSDNLSDKFKYIVILSAKMYISQFYFHEACERQVFVLKSLSSQDVYVLLIYFIHTYSM